MKKNKFLLILCGLFVMNNHLFAEIGSDFIDDFNNSVYLWINEGISSDDILKDMDSYDQILEKQPHRRNKFYWQAKTAMVRGQVFFSQEIEDLALEEFEISRTMAKRSMDGGEYSDGWRLMAEANSYIMLIKGIAYIISHSAEVRQQADKSLEYDPENARATLIIAQMYINAPSFFGGNKKLAVELLEKLKSREDLNIEDKFYIMQALSEVYKALDRKNDAIRNYRIILSLYPGNTVIQRLLSELL